MNTCLEIRPVVVAGIVGLFFTLCGRLGTNTRSLLATAMQLKTRVASLLSPTLHIHVLLTAMLSQQREPKGQYIYTVVYWLKSNYAR